LNRLTARTRSSSPEFGSFAQAVISAIIRQIADYVKHFQIGLATMLMEVSDDVADTTAEKQPSASPQPRKHWLFDSSGEKQQ
jgi:hypothetical protein